MAKRMLGKRGCAITVRMTRASRPRTRRLGRTTSAHWRPPVQRRSQFRRPRRQRLTLLTYYYGACVDTLTYESDSTNNCSEAVEVTLVVYPDLRIGPFVAIGYQIPLIPRGSFYLSARLENEGDGDSAATTVRFYHSTDDTITSADTEVGTVALEALAVGAIVHKRVEELTAPASAGSYYYGACVDAVAGETDTTNNCTKASTLEIPEPAPNLTLLDIDVSDRTRDPGETFTLTVTVFNRGALEAAATTLRYYRTNVSPWILDPSTDTAVGTDSVEALASAAESEESIDLTAPSIPDNYYYYACVDSVTDETETRDNWPVSGRAGHGHGSEPAGGEAHGGRRKPGHRSDVHAVGNSHQRGH